MNHLPSWLQPPLQFEPVFPFSSYWNLSLLKLFLTCWVFTILLVNSLAHRVTHSPQQTCYISLSHVTWSIGGCWGHNYRCVCSAALQVFCVTVHMSKLVLSGLSYSTKVWNSTVNKNIQKNSIRSLWRCLWESSTSTRCWNFSPWLRVATWYWWERIKMKMKQIKTLETNK